MKTPKNVSISGCLVAFALTLLQSPGAGHQEEACSGQKVTYQGPGNGRQLGWAVSCDGALAVIGAPFSNISGIRTGVALVFEQKEGSWHQVARLLPTDVQENDFVGHSVAISGERVLVGAYQHNSGGLSNAGAAYLFERQGGVWVEVAKLTAADMQVSDLFGSSVAIDGDTAVVGARQEGTLGFVAGAAYVFELIGGQWVQTQKLLGSAGQQGDFVGFTAAIQGDWILVGGPGIDGLTTDSGGAYAFQRTPAGWEESALLVPWDEGGTAAPISVHGGRVALGAIAEHTTAFHSGAVYIFELENGSWTPLTKLKAPDPSFNAKLGISVSLGPDGLLAGASSDAEGIAGSGSAYIFAADGAGYSFSRKLRAPDAESHDFFGRAVALSGGTALVGAYGEDSGCPPSIPGCDAGAAWFFEVPAFARGLCFGGTCPCGNADPARGCESSAGKGAGLAACGSASVAADDLAVRAEHLPPESPVMLFRALDALNGGNGVFAGDGLLCIGNQSLRLGLRWADAFGQASWGPGLAPLGLWQPGQTMHLQARYRDPTASPCGTAFNATHALELTFTP